MVLGSLGGFRLLVVFELKWFGCSLGSYIAPRYQIVDAKASGLGVMFVSKSTVNGQDFDPSEADIRDLDVGDVDDMEASCFGICSRLLLLGCIHLQVDVPKPFLDHVKEVRERKNRPKIDFNSEDHGELASVGCWLSNS